MAIDSSLFMADIPAGSYTAGDVIELTSKAGPAIVRSGRGNAFLKRLTVGIVGNAANSVSYWKISVKNSDWIDEMSSITTNLWGNDTGLDERCGAVQRGNDCPLTPNSAWVVTAECLATVTTTVANSIFALLDVDYPAISSIVDPDALTGIPTSIDFTAPSACAVNALGASAAANWDSFSSDIFKAGYEYALQKVEMINSVAGFFSLSNAAGMAGLSRIIPLNASPAAIRNKVEYATKLVKGPMDIRFMLFANSGSASTGSPRVIMDFVKRRV